MLFKTKIRKVINERIYKYSTMYKAAISESVECIERGDKIQHDACIEDSKRFCSYVTTLLSLKRDLGL